MKHTLLAVMAGILSGALALASMSGSSFAVLFLSWVHPLPLFYAGLALGTRPALVAAASSVLVLSVVHPHLGAVFGLIFAVPVWVTIRLLLTGPSGAVRSIPEDQSPRSTEGPETSSTFQDRIIGRVDDWNGEIQGAPRDLGWFPVGHVLAAQAAIGAAYLLGTSMLTGGHLEHNVTEVLNAFASTVAGAQGADVLQDAITRMVPYFPGLFVGMWMLLGLVLNMVMAQALLAKGGRNIRPTPRFRELTLPDVLSWALVVCALLALVSPGEIGYVARNATIALTIPFFMLGLSVVHKLAGMTPLPGAILALTYLVMIFTGWLAFLIAGIGILEQWVGLRKRMDRPDEH
ncbi:DUF2232 domain-containing protein [Magnetovibrio sp. PR-2]|uniref:DUF2232 domain-containing protein n=1 Tax=Magnetovibrio sp. PR-2 TaxID=3120356 RepID=UPI002FCE16EE